MRSAAAPRSPRPAVAPESRSRSTVAARSHPDDARAMVGAPHVSASARFASQITSLAGRTRDGHSACSADVASLPLPEVDPMNVLFEPARAGLVIFACLAAACSGATEPGSDGSSQTGGESRTVAVPSPATSSDATGASGGSSAPSGSSGSSAPASGDSADPAPLPSGGSGGASSGAAVCGPDELCHGISSCTNSCYGPTCCAASCYCPDIHATSSRLVCSLSCSK